MGWDVAVTDDGPLLIEGNHYPGHDIYQLPAHTPDGIGLLPVFEAAAQRDGGMSLRDGRVCENLANPC